jgi:transcriptional regulator with XRE-family HTH domain
MRQSIGYSQAKLAKEMGITVRTITRWEAGEFPVPKLGELALRFLVLQTNSKKGR